MRVRLRPAYSSVELAEIYTVPHYPYVPHDHTFWPDHIHRVNETIRLARELCPDPVQVLADLSCGDGTTARALEADPGAGRVILGDMAAGYELTGPIEETIHQIGHADLFICTETIEHLDDPDAVLHEIRQHAAALVISTPLGEFTDENPQHYWGWDNDGVRDMLTGAGWDPALQWNAVHPLASFQLWACR